MSDCRIDVRNDGVVAINGSLTFETVPECLVESQTWFGGADGPLTVDLAGVAASDSAGVALVLEWKQRADAARRAISFVNAPEQMRHLAQVSGLESLFGPA